MSLDNAELRDLTAIVGARVIAAEPCRWGFENRTAIVTLEAGHRLVVQRISSRVTASHKLYLARELPGRLAAAGIRTPALLAADPDADPPYAVREYLPGETCGSLMGTVEGAVQVARAMGVLLPQLALVATAGVALGDAWASPITLARTALQQLVRCRPLLDEPASAALQVAIAELPARFADRPASFAHGDFCPVNALLADDRRPTVDDQRLPSDTRSLARIGPGAVVSGQSSVVGLLDLEFARIADRLFDAAWWGWVVRYHHPERWLYAWPQLLASAGIADDPENAGRIRLIQRLRCLEMIDYCATTRTREAAAMWVARLATTLGWE